MSAYINADWKAPVKVGWDPSHVYPVGIIQQDAKQGKGDKQPTNWIESCYKKLDSQHGVDLCLASSSLID